MYRNLSYAFMFALMAVSAMAKAPESTPDYIMLNIPHATAISKAHAEYMLIDVYDATLYLSRYATKLSPPFALSIAYTRSLTGEEIADHAIEEIRDQGFEDEIKLAAWHERLRAIIPDVENGTTITGILKNNGESAFYRNGQVIGHIADPEFGQHFFDLWLSQHPSEPVEWIETPNLS